MNDTVIINTISKIHFIIVSFLSFIFITLLTVFILLQNGVYIKDLDLPNLKIKQLYIKWNNKIDITVNEIKINKKNSNKKTDINYKEIGNYLKKIRLFNNWFDQIIINKIIFNDTEGSFKYMHDHNGYLNIHSRDFVLNASLFFESKYFDIHIDKLKDIKNNIELDGDIVFDAYLLEITSKLNLNINNEVLSDVFLYTNTQKLFYKLRAKENIKSIVHTVDMFNLNKKVRYWIVDAIDAKDITLKDAYGWLEYKNISQAYKNLYAKAVLNNLKYTYDKQLKSVDTKNTIVEFKNGVLNIMPQDAHSYGFFLDKSWLKIDFTKKEELLTLYLLFKGALSQDVLNILKRYHIKVPVVQNSGSVDTNLTITVGLRNIKVHAHGKFLATEGNFTYLGLNIDAKNVDLTLDDFIVKIKNMDAKYQDIATARVNVNFDAKNQKGVIDFKTKHIGFKQLDLNLDSSKKDLHIVYTISPKQDTIAIDKSKWIFKNQHLSLEKTTLPFDLSTLTALIPTTMLNLNNNASMYLSGKASLKPYSFDIKVDLFKFVYENIKMMQSNSMLELSYKNKKLTLHTTDEILLKINNHLSAFDDFVLKLDNDKIIFDIDKLRYEDSIKAKATGYYNLINNEGDVQISNLKIKDKQIKKIIQDQRIINLFIKQDKLGTHVDIKDLDINYLTSNDGWKLTINSIEKLAKRSKKLQQYHITNGNLVVSQQRDTNITNFTANIIYPYKLLVQNNIPTDKYKISGSWKDDTKTSKITINDSLKINFKDNIEITGDKIGINLNAIFKYLNDMDKTESNSLNKNIFVDITNSYLWISKDRHVISDAIDIQYFNNTTTAQLRYKKGEAGFKFDNGEFHLYGDDFNDYFMDRLFALSRFKGGKLSFSMHGTTKEYDGIFYISDTTVVKYKILNNILAFIDTVPSLVTFSLPGYNKNGLKVKSAYADFHSKDDVINFKNIYLDSKEIDIVGRGTTNIQKNKIDLMLNLKSNLGSSVNKIPVVGYILLGDDTISTSLSITGKLSDPTVKSLIAKDIIVAPINIIKRALKSPFHMFAPSEK